MPEQLSSQVEMPASPDHNLELVARRALESSRVAVDLEDPRSIVDIAVALGLIGSTETVVEFVAPADLEVAD